MATLIYTYLVKVGVVVFIRNNGRLWSSADFDRFSKSGSPLNQVYDEVFISAFPFGEEVYLLEHNTQLDDEDVGCIRNAFEEFSLYFDTVLSDD